MNTSEANFGSGLKDYQYAKLHELRKSKSTMDQVQNEAFSHFIEQFKITSPRKISILSIGSGNGNLDREWIHIIKQSGLKIKKYVAIEPISSHIDQLRENLNQVLPLKKIEIKNQAIESLRFIEKFDLIHAVHVVHWFQKPIQAIDQLNSYLRGENSQVLIVIQSEKGIPRVYKKLENFHFVQRGCLTGETLKLQLEASRIPAKMNYVESELDVTDIVERRGKGRKLMKFILSQDLKKVSKESFKEIAAAIESLSIRKESQNIIEEPFVFLNIQKVNT